MLMSVPRTTFGSSILPPMNGPGWATAATSRSYHPLYTEREEPLLPEMVLVGGTGLRIGPTAAVIYGSSEVRRLLPPPYMTTIFGSMCRRLHRRYPGLPSWT